MTPISKLLVLLLFTLWPHGIFANDLIASACDRTTYKALCREILEPDPESHEATDVLGLVRVAIKNTGTNATQLRDYVTQVAERNNDDNVLVECLRDCYDNYQNAADQLDNSFVPLQSKGYKHVNKMVITAKKDADSCEEGFKAQHRKSPLIDLSTTFNRLCSNILGLMNQLPKH